ncbi:hypothetical protein Avbf_00189 [Armadillidium vulgare]|nr:hypothetical protein Avbf_00189 [Armadillidium vulgare]
MVLKTPTTLEETYTHSTTEEEEETTLSTEETTTEKHVPPTTSERTSTTPTTTLELTTLSTYLSSSTTDNSTRKETLPYNETNTSFESSTEFTEDSSENATSDYTSVHSTTPNTTLATYTTTPTTVTTTTPETSTPTTTTPETSTPTTTTPKTSTPTTTTPETSTPTTTTTETSTPTTTITTNTTTTPVPSTIPYDHTFKMYKEPEVACTSNGCKDISGKMLDSIDHETDPCENIKQLVVHDTNALKFYDSCLNFFDGTENLKHEEVFPQDWKVDFSNSENTTWPSVHLTKTIGNLIKRDLPVLFDVETDVRKLNGSIKILPKIRISLFDDYQDNYDHKYCIDQFHRQMMELNNRKEEKAPQSVAQSRKKRNTPDDGKGKPENRTEAKVGKLQKEFTEEEEEIIDIDLNLSYQQYQKCMIYLTAANTDGAEKPFEVITLSDLIGNTVLGGIIKWDSLLESLHGSRLEKSQEIIVEDLEKFSRIFSYFKDQWNDKNLENVLLMLAGEKLFKKGEDREYKKNFCFKMAKKYLPLDMQFLFTKSFSEEDLNVLVSEIENLGSTVPTVIPKLSGTNYRPPTQVEFINKTTLELNMENSELALSGGFLDNLYRLQTRYREDMYKMSGKELEDSESCRLLPREVQIPCNLHADRIHVNNQGNSIPIADITEEMKSETLMEFQAFNVAWQVIKHLTSPKGSDVKLNETEELPLIWLGSKSLNPLKAFLIRKAQETCNANNEFDLIRISRFKSPPNSFWINSLIKIDTLYGDAWHCASNSSMAQTRECPPESTTTGWTPIYE